ncbi:rod shape-determining protein MreC [Desulfopila aestuarii DSM 18488]|uniref:Cell shape-determining protein MreC n=1 Tax=Desulfopila aestuarii DSM 18488 TaxID=1121416 RepID=A0A1M7Y0L5_9BACT|nr:rod shape-determining protein MreC [Desulfopila aestuarii DSM 18488]
MVGLLLLASLLGGGFGALHKLTLDLVGPLESAVSRSLSGVITVKDDYLALFNVREDNKRLAALVDKYMQELAERRESYHKFKHYEELLDFKKQEGFGLLTARVVGKDPALWFQTIIIDRGAEDDVVEGMVVLGPSGVIGQIIHTSESYSKVLLANAPSSAIDAMVQKNRVRGILKGAGANGYVLEYVLKNADVVEGDYIVTAGIGGIFQSGIPLGQVSSVRSLERGMFLEIKVRPSVDFQKLEEVFVDLTDRKKILNEMYSGADR